MAGSEDGHEDTQGAEGHGAQSLAARPPGAQAQEGPKVHGRGHGRGDHPWGDNPHPHDGQPRLAWSPNYVIHDRGLDWPPQPEAPERSGGCYRHPSLGFLGVAQALISDQQWELIGHAPMEIAQSLGLWLSVSLLPWRHTVQSSAGPLCPLSLNSCGPIP